MAKVAIVKLDPVETKSTGGVVEEIFIKMSNFTQNDGYVLPWQKYVNDSNYKVIDDASDDVVVGWILQDKTNVLHDPNL